MARRLSDSLIFDSIRLEGGLFVPAVLEKAARGEHTSQRASDYHLPKGLSLVDEQGRAFRIASAVWKNFEPTRARKDVEASRATVGFVTELIRDALGYADLTHVTAPIELAGRSYPVTAFAAGGRVPVIIAPHTLDLDAPDERFAVVGSGSRRRSAYQLAQQFLNASASCVWALVTNGRQLRLVRDADTLTRPAFLEADLDLILRTQRYADFSAIWRIFHASRAVASDALGDACPWESWKKEGQDQGERVREGLRSGVTNALLALGTGFVQHPDNESLRLRLQTGDLRLDDYFQQLLRLVYRYLFLFTVEERGLLHIPDDRAEARLARETYAQGYALRRLRDRALRRAGFDRNSDLWMGIQIVFRGLARGEPRLALPALGGLFAPTQCPALDRAKLENRALLAAMRELRWSKQDGLLAAIDYRNMGSEELGSVYESLLELVPTADLPARRFGFVGLTDSGRTDGNSRKITGSYYTPEDPVQKLLESALEPVIVQKLAGRPADPARALLEISVVDISCGSGHFLLAAARRLAEKLAELRTLDGAVTPGGYRHALREVIAHCIYGVDRNPMALELARTALWLEGFEPGQPLSFLDHHLVCGDSLLGLIDFQAIAKGIPQDAFDSLTGDDKSVAKLLAADNRAALKELEKRRHNTEFFAESGTADLLAELRQLEGMPETTAAEVEAKAVAYATVLQHARDNRLTQAADLVVAAFLAPKATQAGRTRCPTTRILSDLLYPRPGAPVAADVLAFARDLCREARVLHWPLAFAAIFARGGFDCVLGNPPWERIKIQEKEYFAARHPAVAEAQNKSVRELLIESLATGSPADRSLHREFVVAKRTSEAVSVFAHVSGKDGGRFPLTGVGDVNTYALFSETIARVTHPSGRAGFIVPTGIATDDSTKAFFSALVRESRLASLFSFENEEFIFPGVHHAFKFCLMVLSGRGSSPAAQFVFFARQVDYLLDARRNFTLSREDFSLINPNTLTCPIFRSQADAELTKKIYRRVPVMIEEEHDEQPERNLWGISFTRLFDMSNDSGLFINPPTAGALPLYESKMMHQFDHRWATYRWDASEGATGDYVTEDVSDTQKGNAAFNVQPRYWVEERYVLGRLARVPRCVTQAWESTDADSLLAAFANWIEAAHEDDALSGFSASTPRQRVLDTGGRIFAALPVAKDDWLSPKAVAEARAWVPLATEELALLRDATDIAIAAHAILDRRSPRWLMGWRDICRATDTRTAIASVMPRIAVGHTLPLFFTSFSAPHAAALLGNWNSLVLDYIARLKVGGTHLTHSYLKQFPVLPPTAYTKADLAFIVPRVLELTYTSHDLATWAADLGYFGAPFGFHSERRAILRAELDAYYARLYGLSRDELRYVLDPADTHGADYPSETFRGLKANEIKAYGEYRTRRLALEAWDEQSNQVKGVIEIAATGTQLVVPPPDWMDRLLTLPTPARGKVAPDRYRATVVPHLLYQAGGRVSLDRFRRAYWLLTEPATLQRYAKDSVGTVAKAWGKVFRDRLDKDMFIPHLKGAVQRDIHFIRLSGERWLELRRTDHVADDEHAIFDARLALLVADLWPAKEPISPISVADEAVLRELELVS